MVGPRTLLGGFLVDDRQSGGDSMAVDDTSAFENTLRRIRERYALYFYLPEGTQPVRVSLPPERSSAAV
jgi:hypothetical protein